MGPGTKYDLVIELRDRVSRAKRHFDVTDAVLAYWEHPDNVSARKQETSGDEGAEYVLQMTAEFAANADDELDWLASHAPKDQLALRYLKTALAYRVEAGNFNDTTRQQLTKVLRGEYRPKRKGRRTTPAVYHKQLQLSLAVLAVYQGSRGEYSCSGGETTGAMSGKNAFGAVSEATEVAFGTVADAWRNRRFLRGGKFKNMEK